MTHTCEPRRTYIRTPEPVDCEDCPYYSDTPWQKWTPCEDEKIAWRVDVLGAWRELALRAAAVNRAEIRTGPDFEGWPCFVLEGRTLVCVDRCAYRPNRAERSRRETGDW